MGHGYTKQAAKTVDSLLAIDQAKGKNPPPAEINFTTYTLKYNSMYWLQVDGLYKQWEKTSLKGKIFENTLVLEAHNVISFSIRLNQLPEKFKAGDNLNISINKEVHQAKIHSLNDTLRFHLAYTSELKNGKGSWAEGPEKPFWVNKKHNLQGPIDDAFTSAFIVVKPSGVSKNTMFDQWSKAEMNRFIEQWRMQFRGDPVVKLDNEITDADMSANLIAFGDAQSNKLIAKIKDKLPIKWSADNISVRNVAYPAKDHALIMIYPNPLNQKHYIVLNSGFTFREDAYQNNSKQIPMLPDWAVVDLKTPPDFVHPGKIENAGFFSDQWRLNYLDNE
ncbi:MAG: Prolyl oligopeptidase family protein [Mucilaginibacter sp.]|uniref:hypothetical protein n=1 Tax=Mucilaginibacter sp. TaxID=1882438 RepID=UPI002617E5EC|nr:hypothetical protein [Mucilaginibacter sp.]MDB5003682.1 Prolyl oligopeptidase family protein [Mucilaginibacter sp.]